VSEAAKTHLRGNGGVLYVRARGRRCCSGPLTVLDATTECPSDLAPYRATTVDGISVLVAIAGSPPAELAIEMRGIRRTRVVASWDGCAFRSISRRPNGFRTPRPGSSEGAGPGAGEYRHLAGLGRPMDLAGTQDPPGSPIGRHPGTTKSTEHTQEGPAMARICEARIVIVTGAGRGIGRSHALEFASQGAKVVVNDLGAKMDGTGADGGPANEVVSAIQAMGGEAIANGDDVSDFDGAKRLIDTAIDTFGGLDVLVNNAGILRDRMLINMTPEEWDAVIRVHLRGTFAPAHHAAVYWRERTKTGETNDARIINTSSSSGIYGNIGQSNYGAAKAGIAAFTIITAMELARYGITVNAIAPGALTRMTEGLRPDEDRAKAGEFDSRSPDNIAPLVVWLGSKESAGISGRVFNVAGGTISVAEGWDPGPSVEKGDRWDPAELGAIIPGLVEKAAPNEAELRRAARS
jgi:NAD(P)-dependent dehydrogenase (short-subunit alcohol dehydrogenase family)